MKRILYNPLVNGDCFPPMIFFLLSHSYGLLPWLLRDWVWWYCVRYWSLSVQSLRPMGLIAHQAPCPGFPRGQVILNGLVIFSQESSQDGSFLFNFWFLIFIYIYFFAFSAQAALLSKYICNTGRVSNSYSSSYSKE